MTHSTPLRLNLMQLRKQAKETLKAHHAGDPGASPVLRRLPKFATASAPEILAQSVSLADVQFALAKEHGFDSWAHIKRFIEGNSERPKSEFKQQGGATWITRVPMLGWGLDRDCTFCGAFESALQVTEDPWTYAELMGLTGLAFRVRWSPDFCPSCAIGEMPDECRHIREATGWETPTDVQFGQENPDRDVIRRKLVRSIDVGLPVMAYGLGLDMSVVYGYEDHGRTLWLTDYHGRGKMPVKLPLEKLGPMQVYLHKSKQSLEPMELLRYALTVVTTNWHRQTHDGGIPGREYRYGLAAYEGWIESLRTAKTLSPEQKQRLHHTNNLARMTLADARQAAARFLSQWEEVDSDFAAPLRKATELCANMASLLYRVCDKEDLFGGRLEDWSSDQRRRECDVLDEASRRDIVIHDELQVISGSRKAVG